MGVRGDHRMYEHNEVDEHGHENEHGRIKIVRRVASVDIGYARLAQFWTALAVTIIGGIVIAMWTHHDTRQDAIEQLIQQNNSRLGIIEEKQSQHESEITSMESRLSKLADTINDRISKMGDDVVHLRERLVCVEHHGSCAGRVPD